MLRSAPLRTSSIFVPCIPTESDASKSSTTSPRPAATGSCRYRRGLSCYQWCSAHFVRLSKPTGIKPQPVEGRPCAPVSVSVPRQLPSAIPATTGASYEARTTSTEAAIDRQIPITKIQRPGASTAGCAYAAGSSSRSSPTCCGPENRTSPAAEAATEAIDEQRRNHL